MYYKAASTTQQETEQCTQIFSDGYVTFHRDTTDPRLYGTRFARGEHRLMRRIATWLNARGFDLIRKRAQDDGHMIGDRFQPYLRCRKPRTGVPHVYVWSGFYALRREPGLE